MRVLALDTTTLDGSVAIAIDGRVLLEHVGARERPHAERLPGDLLDALAQAEWTIDRIDVLAVVAGPGSFTGLRIGIAAVQGLAMVHRIPVVAVSALEALGHAARAGRAAGTYVGAWMDAHRKEVFSALYRVGHDGWQPGALQEIEGARAGDAPATLARWRAAGHAPAAIAGDGAVAWADATGGAVDIVPHPRLASIAALMATASAERGETLPPGGIMPVYVRRPDAEVARDARRAQAAASPSQP